MKAGFPPIRVGPCHAALLFSTSASVLAYEILLMRLLSIGQWYHFVYMIISLALLGYGAAGSLLFLLMNRIRKRMDEWLVGLAGATGVSFSLAFTLCLLRRRHPPKHGLPRRRTEHTPRPKGHEKLLGPRPLPPRPFLENTPTMARPRKNPPRSRRTGWSLLPHQRLPPPPQRTRQAHPTLSHRRLSIHAEP